MDYLGIEGLAIRFCFNGTDIGDLLSYSLVITFAAVVLHRERSKQANSPPVSIF
jgi:hypothetical protein